MNKLLQITLAALTGTLATSAFAAAHRDEAVYRAAEANRAEVLDTLKAIVDIDSGSGDAAGGEKVERVLVPHLEASGAQVRFEPAETEGLAPNLVAVFHGTGAAKILIIAHVDTVFGPGTAAKRPFVIQGDRALGAGVGDEKAGVVNAVVALKILHDLHFDKFGTITLLLDRAKNSVLRDPPR